MFWDWFYSILALFTGVGIFLVGIVMFSECLEKNASKGMRSLLKKISNNRFAGMGVGAGVTALVQSSSATTVMVIGLVNTGILTLFQATAIIMGANIGTTITGLLVSLSTFKIKYIFMAMAFVGALGRLFSKKDRVIRICDLLISFGILFVGLELMSDALSTNEVLLESFRKLFEKVEFPLLLIVLGAVFTAAIQSSSASTAIFLSMVTTSILTFKSALFLVIGANIGTCITALLASFAANTNAKRTAFIHILFNLIGAIIFTAVMWPLADTILPYYQKIIPQPMWQLSVFHVIFNVVTTLVIIGFITPLNRLACFVIKDKTIGEGGITFTYIDERLLSTPSIAIEQTIKEINDMAKTARENLDIAMNALFVRDLSEKERVAKNENKVDFLNQSLARYLVKISASPISYTNEKLIGGFHHVINDIERIGDYADNIFEDAALMLDYDIVFSQTALDGLKSLYEQTTKLFDLSIEVFNDRKTAKLQDVSRLEQKIDLMKTELADSHIKRLNEGQCTFEGGDHFYTTITALERIADHLTNIAFTIRSYTGDENEAFKKIQAETERGKGK